MAASEEDNAASSAVRVGTFVSIVVGAVAGAAVSQPRFDCAANIFRGGECSNWIGLPVNSLTQGQTSAFGLLAGAIVGLIAYVAIRAINAS